MVPHALRSKRLGSRSWWATWHARLNGLLTHDFCPWANRYVYWLKQPIGWFVVATGMSLLVGCFLGPQGLVLAAALSGVIALGVAWPFLAVHAVRCSLHFDRRRAREGEPMTVRLQVANRLPWPVWGLAVERGFFAALADATADAVAVALARVPGWSISEFDWEFRPSCRGVYPTEPPVVACGFPFGIWTARRRVTVAGEFIVWPRTVRLSSVPPLSGRAVTVAALFSRQIGHEGDVLGVRPFRQGDSLRRVHWAQTARHDQLIVCERQATARRTVRIWIDAEPDAHPGCGADGSLEWCIRIGASLCREFVEHHMPVDLRIDACRQLAAPGPAGIRQALDMLARFVPRRVAGESPHARRAFGTGDGLLRTGSSHGREACHMTILVTTDRGWDRVTVETSARGCSHAVVLQTGSPDSDAWTSRSGCDRPTPWIVLDMNGNIELQLQHQWERVCRESWVGAF